MEEAVLLTVACAGAFGCAGLAGAGAFEGFAKAYSSVRAGGVPARGFTVGEKRRGGPLRAGGARLRVSDCVASMAAYYLRNGVESCSGMGKALLGLSGFGRTMDDAACLLKRRGIEATAKSLASLCALITLSSSVVFLLLFHSLLAGLLAPVCLLSVVSAAVSQGRVREQDALRDQVPDALRCMEACLHAGLSLPQAFAEVAKEIPQPAKESFARVSRDLELGYSMTETLERFHSLSGIAELGFVAMALDVQHACGGSVTPILHSAEDSLARGLELRRSLRVQTAQARMSAQIVSVMPFFLLLVLSAVSPGFLAPFFESVEGVALLGVALAMQMTGVLMVRRILAVEI